MAAPTTAPSSATSTLISTRIVSTVDHIERPDKPCVDPRRALVRLEGRIEVDEVHGPGLDPLAEHVEVVAVVEEVRLGRHVMSVRPGTVALYYSGGLAGRDLGVLTRL